MCYRRRYKGSKLRLEATAPFAVMLTKRAKSCSVRVYPGDRSLLQQAVSRYNFAEEASYEAVPISPQPRYL